MPTVYVTRGNLKDSLLNWAQYGMILSVILLSFWTCNLAFSQEMGCDTFDVEGAEITFRCKIHPNLPTYVFHVYMREEDQTESDQPMGFYLFERIELSREGDPAIIQTFVQLGGGEGQGKRKGVTVTHLDLRWSPFSLQGMDPAHFFGAEDINFDGYLDFKILSEYGGSAGDFYTYCLFNKEGGTFLCDKAISLQNPTLNPQTQEITTYLPSGACGYTRETSKWENEGLALVREESQNCCLEDKDGKFYCRKVIKERKNGGMVVVKEEITKP